MAKGVNYCDFANADKLASQIANNFTDWESRRVGWKRVVKEVRDYIFATDTRTTTAGRLPWKNSVHNPKLCQIRDNLSANYDAAIFSNPDYIPWEGDDQSSNTKDKRN